MSYGASLVDLDRTRRDLCGQNPQRRKARRAASGTTDKVRASDQLKDCKADRSHDPGECPGAGGSSD